MYNNNKALESGDMPEILEIEEEDVSHGNNLDELMAERDFRQLEQMDRGRADTNYKQNDESKHPTRRLTIVNNEVFRPERLLYKV